MSTMSIFNIGTGHTKSEKTQTMTVLHDDCTDTSLRYINDGPHGGMGFNAAVGWGMNTIADATFEWIVQRAGLAGVDTINLTGHSRGAILCHMLAHRILTSLSTRDINVNMIVIDPVHQSKIDHEGAESLVNSSRLLSYRAIIMENVNSGLYPFKFVDGWDGNNLQNRVYYIRMPGTHGSGTQAANNPVGKVVKEVIRNFLEKRGTHFGSSKKSALEMCELFAEIHAENPLNSSGERKIFDYAKEGKNPKVSFQSTAGRQIAVQSAMSRNRRQPRRLRPNVGTVRQGDPYFFNELHANFFRKAFPNLFAAWRATHMQPSSRALYDPEIQTISGQPYLNKTFKLFMEQVDFSNY